MPSLAAAKYRLFNRAPYWSHLLSTIPLREVPRPSEEVLAANPGAKHALASASRTGITFYTEAWEESGCDDEHAVTVLAHELLHYVMDYFGRLGSRDHTLWNIAQDAVINATLRDAGYRMPAGGVYPESFGAPPGLSADAYYDFLSALPKPPDNSDCATGSDHGDGDGTGAEGAAGSDNDSQRAIARAARNFAKGVQSAEQGKQQGLGSLCGDLALEEEVQAKVDWKDALYDLVRAAITSQGGSDAAKYGRLSARQGGLGYGPGCPRLPAWQKRRFDVAVALDTSGSMVGELATLQAELESICSAAGGSVRLIQCDAEVTADSKHTKGQRLALKGGGGTDFRPVFEAVKGGKRPDVLVYATDGYGSFPDSAPGYPVIWAIVGGFTGVPFGKEVKVER